MDAKQLIENVAPHSVSLSTNAKGLIQCEIKCYADDPQEAANRALAVLRKLRIQLGDEMAHA